MTEVSFRIGSVPAVLYGARADAVWLFVHGRCGCKEEGRAFADVVCPRAQVLAVDLPEHGARKGVRGFDPMHAVPELREVMTALRRDYGRVGLRANSIGAWFSLLAFSDAPPDRALLVSPLLDMEGLIRGMMRANGVTEDALARAGTVPVRDGDALSYDYLQYVRAHPVTRWEAPTALLYAGTHPMTSRAAVDDFSRRFGCALTVMADGEHWFHTPGQLAFLRRWETDHARL